ncbi:MAG: hypothetical protein Sapg2KO_24480 [Saprospiraceae bacterium]
MKKTNNRKSISQQFGNIKSKYRHFKVAMSRNSLVVNGSLRPTSRSESYNFILEYTFNKNPKVRIISPKLKRNSKGDKIPHMYGQKHLCLHMPKYNEFKSSDFLSEKIIPWISLWLYYYEKWHITDKWLGGGEHPVEKRRKNEKKR